MAVRRFVVAAFVVAVVGCSTQSTTGHDAPNPTQSDGSPNVIAASQTSTDELGVTQWKITDQSDGIAMTGYDTDGTARAQYRIVFSRDEAGVERTTIASTLDRAAVFQFSTGEEVFIERNDFLDDPAASRLLDLAIADLAAKRGAGTGVQTKSLRPLDTGLVSDQCAQLVKSGISCDSVKTQTLADCQSAKSNCPSNKNFQKCMADPTACAAGSCDRQVGQCSADWKYYESLGCYQCGS